MLSRFFIDRPVFAWVVAIVIMLAGLLSIFNLPVSQYPMIAPPQVAISATYPGASAETIENTVTQVIEQNLTGLDGYLYMSSTSDSSGRVSITVTFEAGTNPDMAQVQVQNKIQTALSTLPQVVQQLGVKIEKTSANFLMVVGFISTDGKLSAGDLGDFLVSSMQEPLSRVPGVGEAQVFGASYAMRIWLNPEKLVEYALNPSDIEAAISAQNAQISTGGLAQQPTDGKQQYSVTVSSASLLQTPEEFRNIFLKVQEDGSEVRLGDVARVEIGLQSYTALGTYEGKASSGMAINLASGANALSTAEAVMNRVEELRPTFPEGVDVVIPFDTTPFVRAALHEVVKTLVEAIVLVVIVMFLFLQNWRATLIPTIAVPVVLLGTFAVLAAAGFSINMLTMFAMVLAIGLLVDDAIVVVENVERVMREDGSSPRDATIKSMGQIQGALIGIAMVLSAVFVPMAFFGGSTGVIYRQFSITIVSAMVLSVVVALTLTPMLCSKILKPIDHEEHAAKGGFFGWFNRGFLSFTDAVTGFVGHSLNAKLIMGAAYLVVVGAMVLGFIQLSTGMVVNMVMECRQGKVGDAIFNEGTWFVIFAGLALFVLKIGNIGGVPVVLCIGVLMLIYGSGREAKGFGKVTAVFGAVYNGLTGWFGDILSYSRLMALMLAGSVIAQVFNTLAAMPSSGGVTVVSMIVFIIIFLLGHLLNFGLNLLGCFVHDLRLQCLEFFNKFYEDGGKPFRPLAMDTKYVDITE